MKAEIEGYYRYFAIEEPYNTTTLPAHIRAQMGLVAQSLNLEGGAGSEMLFNSQQYIAGDFTVRAPEGRFSTRNRNCIATKNLILRVNSRIFLVVATLDKN